MSLIRDIYKLDYRAFSELPTRRIGVTKMYTNISDRQEIKKCLMEDFNNKCVYCGWGALIYGGEIFHIDHVKSQKNFPELVNDYNNFVLSCPICNSTKNDKELPNNLDPISDDFRQLFYRDSYGAIKINRDLSVEQQNISNECLKVIGLHKELYKLDYIYASLERIKDHIVDQRTSDTEIIYDILEILRIINTTFTRKTQVI